MAFFFDIKIVLFLIANNGLSIYRNGYISDPYGYTFFYQAVYKDFIFVRQARRLLARAKACKTYPLAILKNSIHS